MRLSNRFQTLIIYLISLFALAGFLPWAGLSPAAAVQPPDENWAVPANLSKSGAASNPVMVSGANGQFHVVWSDQFSGTVYTNGDGVSWAEPAALKFPFKDSTPTFLTGPEGIVHAFWVVEGPSVWSSGLYYSRVDADDFSNPYYWKSPVHLTDPVVDFDVAMDGEGEIHLSYIQALTLPDSQAGVYYLHSQASGAMWTQPFPLDQSPYFRSISSEDANIEIAVGNKRPAGGAEAADDSAQENQDGAGHARVHVVWDNPAKERVYYAMSVDGGGSWEEPVEVDNRVEGTVSGPLNIRVGVAGEEVILLWQSENNGQNCVQYYKPSVDGGDTWLPRQRMLTDLPGCPLDNEFVPGAEDFLILKTSIFGQFYLLAWDGARWSSPQTQSTLSGFVDQDTLQTVNLDCQQSMIVNTTHLYVVGCDQNSGQDIWLTSRQLGNVLSWFEKGGVWLSLTKVAGSDLDMLDPVLAADSREQIHAFWSRANSHHPDGPGMAIHYARLTDDQWSRPEVILRSPQGKADELAVVISPDGMVFVVWSGGDAGEIYFSRAESERAHLPAAWSKPVMLPSPQPRGSSPDILLDSAGVLYVAYTIPFNEQRGIYLTRSEDQGQTWMDPVLVFDAAGAGWERVNDAHLAWTEAGSLHLLWSRYALPGGVGPEGLFYARSDDLGAHWSQPEMVLEAPLLWSEMVGLGDRVVHRLWQELSGGQTMLWHEASLDNGASWRRIAPASIFSDLRGEPVSLVDGAGRLHLFQLVSWGADNYMLQHWSWNGENWETNPSFSLDQSVRADLEELAAVLSPQGKLGIAFSGELADPDTGIRQEGLFYTGRRLEMPAVSIIPHAELVAEVERVPTQTPQIEPSPTPETFIAVTGQEISQAQPVPAAPTPNAWMGSVVGAAAAGLMVLAIFVYVARKANQ